MSENEIGNVEGEYWEGVVEGIVLMGCEVVEYDWDRGETMRFQDICVCTIKDVLSNNDDCNPWYANILLRSSLLSVRSAAEGHR